MKGVSTWMLCSTENLTRLRHQSFQRKALHAKAFVGTGRWFRMSSRAANGVVANLTIGNSKTHEWKFSCLSRKDLSVDDARVLVQYLLRCKLRICDDAFYHGLAFSYELSSPTLLPSGAELFLLFLNWRSSSKDSTRETTSAEGREAALDRKTGCRQISSSFGERRFLRMSFVRLSTFGKKQSLVPDGSAITHDLLENPCLFKDFGGSSNDGGEDTSAECRVYGNNMAKASQCLVRDLEVALTMYWWS
ncbi:hypothetical protein G7K_3620-t1 [Saitoella complicata NRRL Y-17804]|uniref:Uncharacterized protein n=1 Tax=Saitoella complicata (strain BCRC 22490 / CBS 7301 / JCM 7358 / NBRC 10748 / NRRL Y-17804) TaxID=698492 RepID=A0A0E9NJ92_SAICN|nr:hypothetical protein G7K_3620-t1 [Saitoella complicata NRRL Y-17804]